MTSQALRGRNALGSAGAAYLALTIVSLWVGGPEEFLEILLGFTPLFLGIASVAGVLGLFLSASRIVWSVLIGSLCGFIGAVGIVMYVVSKI